MDSEKGLVVVTGECWEADKMVKGVKWYKLPIIT